MTSQNRERVFLATIAENIVNVPRRKRYLIRAFVQLKDLSVLIKNHAIPSVRAHGIVSVKPIFPCTSEGINPAGNK